MSELFIRKATIQDVSIIQDLNNELFNLEKIQYGEINNMFIKNKYRGNGIGKVLINHFKDYCREFNVYDLKVVASCKNINAIEFYKTCGFSEFDVTLTANFN